MCTNLSPRARPKVRHPPRLDSTCYKCWPLCYAMLCRHASNAVREKASMKRGQMTAAPIVSSRQESPNRSHPFLSFPSLPSTSAEQLRNSRVHSSKTWQHVMLRRELYTMLSNIPSEGRFTSPERYTLQHNSKSGFIPRFESALDGHDLS